MNANHARPMLAFWLLAAVAAAITTAGLRAGESGVTVRSRSPSAVSTSATPDVLLGSPLRPVPSGAASVAGTGPVISAAALEYATRIATATPQVSVRPPTRRPSQQVATESARATTTPTASPTTKAGSHQGESHGSMSTTTLTATTTSPGKGHQGPGRDDATAPGKAGAH